MILNLPWCLCRKRSLLDLFWIPHCPCAAGVYPWLDKISWRAFLLTNNVQQRRSNGLYFTVMPLSVIPNHNPIWTLIQQWRRCLIQTDRQTVKRLSVFNVSLGHFDIHLDNFWIKKVSNVFCPLQIYRRGTRSTKKTKKWFSTWLTYLNEQRL